MSSVFISTVLSAIPVYKYGLLFVLTMIEGPLVTMGAGWLLNFYHHLNPLLVYTIVVCADVSSDVCYYSLGRWGGRQIIKKFVAPQKLEKMERLMHTYTGKTLTIAKLTNVAIIPFLIAAGFTQVSFKKFVLYNTLATLPKSLGLLLIGYFFSQTIGVINQYLEYGGLLAITGIAILFIVYMVAGNYAGKQLLPDIET